MRGKAHSEETKAAVMAALLAGQGVTEVAKKYNIDHSIVSRWRQQIPEGKLHEVARKKGEEFEDALFVYLKANMTALAAQAGVASEPDYLRKNKADSLAVLHGVMADKAVRFLEALAAGKSGEQTDTD